MGARCLIFKIKLVQELCKLKFYLGQGVMCVRRGGGYNFSIGSKKFKLCLENKTVPGAQLKVLGYKIMQHQSLISFNLLNISTLKKHVLIVWGGGAGGLLGSKAAITDF